MKTFFTFSVTKRNLLCVYVSLLILIFTFNVNAATQGTAGPTSTGTISVLVVNNDLAWIKGLDDINLGTWSGTGDMSGDDDICVLTNFFPFATNNYIIRASGDGDVSDPSAFTLSNGAQDIYYRVFFTDLNTQVELLPGQLMGGRQFIADPGFFASLPAASGCPVPNANVEIRIEAAELATGGGTHTGILVLELIPE